MKSRYLLSAGAALAVAFGCAEANAQFAWLGGPYPVAYYVGPEGGWSSLNSHNDAITTPPFRVDNAGVVNTTGPFFNSFSAKAKFDSGFNAGARLGIQWGRYALKKSIATGITGFPISWVRPRAVATIYLAVIAMPTRS
jgi:hypothetical protein